LELTILIYTSLTQMRSIECEGISSLRKIEQGMVIEEAFINADPRE